MPIATATSLSAVSFFQTVRSSSSAMIDAGTLNTGISIIVQRGSLHLFRSILPYLFKKDRAALYYYRDQTIYSHSMSYYHNNTRNMVALSNRLIVLIVVERFLTFEELIFDLTLLYILVTLLKVFKYSYSISYFSFVFKFFLQLLHSWFP